VIELDAATVLLQWSTGGLLFMWVTTRRRELSLGYGWLMRGIFILLAAMGVVSGFRYGLVLGRELAQIGVVVAASVALCMSVIRRKAGVSGHIAEHDRRSERVAAMTGIERTAEPRSAGVNTKVLTEFDPRLDLVAPFLGSVGLVFAGAAAGGNDALAIARTLAGAAFLGAVTDAMLLGHWYLVQPGLKRGALVELVRWVGYIWPIEVGLLLVPTGMVSVWTGAIDDGYQGILGWFWGVSAITTIVLVFVTMAALKERYYSAVMAATGLLYLAILTAFGTDLIARALLAST